MKKHRDWKSEGGSAFLENIVADSIGGGGSAARKLRECLIDGKRVKMNEVEDDRC